MKNKEMIITMTPEEIKENPFISKDGKLLFYRFVAKEFCGFDNLKNLNCCKINVAKNIQDAWFDYVKENWEDPEKASTGLAIELAISGPKALGHIPDNCVELEAEALEW